MHLQGTLYTIDKNSIKNSSFDGPNNLEVLPEELPSETIKMLWIKPDLQITGKISDKVSLRASIQEVIFRFKTVGILKNISLTMFSWNV
jgi:hypothetical protein